MPRQKRKVTGRVVRRKKSRLTLFYALLIILLFPLLVWVVISMQRSDREVLPASESAASPK